MAQIAQNLQNLTALLGGSLVSGQAALSQLGGLAQAPVTPHTSRYYHHGHTQTPQSGAPAPPTSSPLGSEYSDLPSSSPLKYDAQERGRSRSLSQHDSPRRPKSALRNRSRSSKGRSLPRRVSFSSPEAIHINDEAFVSQSSGLEDSDIATNVSRNHRRRISGHDYHHENSQSYPHGLSSRRGSMRAQTPGPPEGHQSPQYSLQRSRTTEDLSRRDHRSSRPRTPSSHYHSVDMQREHRR